MIIHKHVQNTWRVDINDQLSNFALECPWGLCRLDENYETQTHFTNSFKNVTAQKLCYENKKKTILH